MDEGDRQRVGRRIDGAAVEADLAGIGGVDAGEDLDQRRLAGAVLAEQRMHLAAPDVEVDVVERQRAGEALGQAADMARSGGCACRGAGCSSIASAMARSRPDRSPGRGHAPERDARPEPVGTRRPMLLHAPDFEIVLLVVVAGDEGVLVAAFGVDVLLA